MERLGSSFQTRSVTPFGKGNSHKGSLSKECRSRRRAVGMWLTVELAEQLSTYPSALAANAASLVSLMKTVGEVGAAGGDP